MGYVTFPAHHQLRNPAVTECSEQTRSQLLRDWMHEAYFNMETSHGGHCHWDELNAKLMGSYTAEFFNPGPNNTHLREPWELFPCGCHRGRSALHRGGGVGNRSLPAVVPITRRPEASHRTHRHHARPNSRRRHRGEIGAPHGPSSAHCPSSHCLASHNIRPGHRTG